MQTTQIGVLMTPVVTNSPAVNSSEAPGRKNPTSKPHSAKMIKHSPAST